MINGNPVLTSDPKFPLIMAFDWALRCRWKADSDHVEAVSPPVTLRVG